VLTKIILGTGIFVFGVSSVDGIMLCYIHPAHWN